MSMGGGTDPACWLFPLRFGMTPEKAASLGLDIGVDAKIFRVLAGNHAKHARLAPSGTSAAGGAQDTPAGLESAQE